MASIVPFAVRHLQGSPALPGLFGILAFFAPQSLPSDAISGVVADETGPVAGATVRVQATSHTTITDADGRFTLTGLTPGQSVPLTAYARGYYIAGGEEYLPGSKPVDLKLIAHAERDNPDYEWLSAFTGAGDDSNCQNCHADPDNSASTLPFDEWLRDSHSKSARNPRFLTMYSGTNVHGDKSPPTRFGSARDYGSFPLRPDTSQPYYGPGYKLDFPGTAGTCAACHAPAASVNAPYGTDPTAVTGVGAEGVACDFCHKVWNVRLDPDTGLPYPNTPGVLSFELRRPPQGHQFFAGPFDDVAPGEDTFSPLHQQSRFCAPCHFGVFWETAVYNSFGEWLDSPYSDSENGKTCQSCHMPTGASSHFTRIDKGGLKRDPQTIFSHRMPGAGDEALLENAVTMDVSGARRSGRLVVNVSIVNDRTGHHVPTDSPLRHLILLVQATDVSGRRLSQRSGPKVPEWGGEGAPEQGNYAGMPGTAYAKVLQEVWTSVYPSGAYWNRTRVLSDNRIAAQESDETSYEFAAPANGKINVLATLIYRRAFIELARQKGWEMSDIVMARQSISLTDGH